MQQAVTGEIGQKVPSYSQDFLVGIIILRRFFSKWEWGPRIHGTDKYLQNNHSRHVLVGARAAIGGTTTTTVLGPDVQRGPWQVAFSFINNWHRYYKIYLLVIFFFTIGAENGRHCTLFCNLYLFPSFISAEVYTANSKPWLTAREKLWQPIRLCWGLRGTACQLRFQISIGRQSLSLRVTRFAAKGDCGEGHNTRSAGQELLHKSCVWHMCWGGIRDFENFFFSFCCGPTHTNFLFPCAM